jgi:hypothetical protein
MFFFPSPSSIIKAIQRLSRTYNTDWQNAIDELNEQVMLEDPTVGDEPSDKPGATTTIQVLS